MSLQEQLSLEKSNVGFGAACTGFDIRNLLGNKKSIAELEEVIVSNQVVAFRDQTLTPQQLVDFSNLFGELEPHVRKEFWHPEQPEILVISNIIENGRAIGSREEGFGWHTDLSYMSRPTSYTILYALEVPKNGGETLFANMQLPDNVVSPELRENLRGRNVHYSFEKMWMARPGKRELTEEQRQRTPPVAHPIIRTHPIRGEDLLYFNAGTCIGMDGYAGDEAESLLRKLQQAATSDGAIYKHNWKKGDLVIWDNRTLFHRATPYDMEQDQRLIYRVSVRGEKPYLQAA